MEYNTGTAPPTPPPPPPPPYGNPVTGFRVNTSNPPPQNHPSTPAEWSTGLCHCSSDWLLWCITCWCRCITFGQIAEIVDKGSPPCVVSGGIYALLQHMTGCAGGRLYSGIYRSKMRKQYMLPESPCGDCLVHCCCEPCALRQEYRELQSHGFDMSIGWEGNMERQNRGVEMAPAVQGGMTR